ncbi:ATP/GTP-binding protein, partial [Streptomyces sp. NPDC055721]
HGTPFVVACNDFGGPAHSPAEIREALDLADEVPLVFCDARSRESGKQVLISLVEHLKTHLPSDPQPIPQPIPEPTP